MTKEGKKRILKAYLDHYFYKIRLIIIIKNYIPEYFQETKVAQLFNY